MSALLTQSGLLEAVAAAERQRELDDKLAALSQVQAEMTGRVQTIGEVFGNRQADLVSPFQGRMIGSLAAHDALFDVLDLDDRVVNEDPDHQGQRQQGDHVERKAQQGHNRERGDQ